jgi:hypothetical protein
MSMLKKASLVTTLFHEGLNNRNPSKVRQAIDMGVDVKAPLKIENPENPLVSFLSKNEHWYEADEKIPASPTQITNARDNIAEITDMLLGVTQDFTSANDKGFTLADQVLSNITREQMDYNNYAKVVTTALFDTLSKGEAPYKPDFVAILAGKTGLTRENAHSALMQTMLTVKERLLNPETQYEKILEIYHDRDVGAWMDQLSIPALKYVPAPPERYTAANKAFVDAITHDTGAAPKNERVPDEQKILPADWSANLIP